jgi:hypothetical protein
VSDSNRRQFLHSLAAVGASGWCESPTGSAAAAERTVSEEGVFDLGSFGLESEYQWAASHPTMVERIAPFCGTAKTTPHNALFLQGLRAALTADAAWMGGDYREQPVLGMRAFSRVYAGWGLSQPPRRRACLKLGAGSSRHSGARWRAQASTRPTRSSSNAKSKRFSRFDQALMACVLTVLAGVPGDG